MLEARERERETEREGNSEIGSNDAEVYLISIRGP